MALLVHPERF
jgi:hypothetical protein